MSTIAVIGAGTMGHALALVFALGEHQVKITDRSPDTLRRAPSLMAKALDTLVEAGAVDPSWTPENLNQRVEFCDRLSDTVGDAAIVVEAIIEKPEAKRQLYAELDTLLDEDSIIASNTSNLDIFPLLPTRRRRNSLIAHWYSPPYIVDLVDLVPGDETDPAAIETVRSMVLAMGKVPVVFKRFIAGYVANRIQEAINLEIFRLLDDGVVTPRDIDDSVIHGLALRMPILGVVAKLDFTGLELVRTNLANRPYTPPNPTGWSTTLNRLAELGRNGVISGAGFFDWDGRSQEELMSERDRRLLAVKRATQDIAPLRGR
jgi:3-hydroxybutyryl-CoA dehydrogenase